MSAFADAAAALHADDADLCSPFVAALPVAGVGISTLGDPFGSETVCASSPAAARLDEIQLDLGEGPCWEALRRHRPVLTPDLQRATADGWPAALHAMQATGIGGVFAFPMRVGTIDVGAVDLYTEDRAALSPAAVDDASALAEIVARRVLHRALVAADADGSTEPEPGRYSRREVYQATGMVAAQLAVSVDDALLVLRSHAYASGRTVLDVAAAVVGRRLDFSDTNASER